MEKTCSKCLIKKEDLDFVFKNKLKNIRHSVCKDCQKAYKIKYYNANKESHYKRNIKKNNEMNAYILSIKISGCVVCKETEPTCLDFHHLFNKIESVARLKTKGNISKLKEEVSKCVVLCANCHRKLHAGIIEL